jgi:hypothetical protein
VRDALATLPWVEQGSIQMKFDKRELRFRLKDKATFNEAEVKDALKAQGFSDVKVVSVNP